MINWIKSEEWRRAEDTFAIVVKHTKTTSNPRYCEGPHQWNVYAYIHSHHPLFMSFNKYTIGSKLPLRNDSYRYRYAYFDRYYTPDGKCASIQIGKEYRHGSDSDRLQTFAANPTQASEVFDDADALFDYLAAATFAGTTRN